LTPPTSFINAFNCTGADLTSGDIPQCSRPFADRLVIDIIITRAMNHGSKRVRFVVEWKASEVERMSKKPVGPSTNFVMRDGCKYRF
jgi:hypothetical protein